MPGKAIRRVCPIKPEDVAEKKAGLLPNEVISSFNELVAQKWDGRSAVVLQNEVVGLMVQKGLNRSEIFSKHWLDVEHVYEKAGWDVEYDKPAYNEDYPAKFTFKRKQK